MIRNIDENGDWVYGKGKSDFKKDLDGLIVDLTTRLREWKRDCFFAESNGVDYYNLLDRGTQPLLDRDVKRIILQTVDVLRINNFTSELDRDGRNYSISANISSIYGDINNFSFDLNQ